MSSDAGNPSRYQHQRGHAGRQNPTGRPSLGRGGGRYAGRGRMATDGPQKTSYLDLLRRQEKTVNNPRDAEQVFRILLKQKDSPETLALTCDPPLLPVIQQCLAILDDDLGQPLELLATLGAEKLSYGIYASYVLNVFRAFLEAPGFMGAVHRALLDDSLQDPAALAWMLLKLAPGHEELRQCRDPLVRDVVWQLLNSTAIGMGTLVPRMKTVFASVSPPTSAEIASNADSDGLEDTGELPESLLAAKVAMRAPGERNHDNDHADYRSIQILPTPSELNCDEMPYLPPMEGSGFISDREAAMLDRQFRLLREDMLGSVREEMAEEVAAGPNKWRRLYKWPALVGISSLPQPYVRLSVPMPQRLESRIKKMRSTEMVDFFENGPGRRVLAKDSLVLLMEEVCSPPGDAQRELQLQVAAVGIVVTRREKDWNIVDKSNFKTLQVGVLFVDPYSMSRITSKLCGLQFRARSPVVSKYLFNASAGYFTYEPVLHCLQQMQGIPLADTLAHLQPPGIPEGLAHAGRQLSEFTSDLRSAVEADETQCAAIQLTLSSRVSLIQGPPGTGKTYVGVQIVKAMLEGQRTWPLRAMKPLKILCMCFTNHALDSFLESLMDAGIPAESFIRLGSSPKISDRLKSRCLRELPDSQFTSSERWGYAMLKREAEELTKEVESLEMRLNKADWGTSATWWAIVAGFLEDDYYVELEQLTVPFDYIQVSDGFQIAGAGNKTVQPNYLWERWCQGKDRGIFRSAAQNTGSSATYAEENIWDYTQETRQELKAQWNTEWLQSFHERLATVMTKLISNKRSMDDLKLSSQSRVLQDATIVGCTTVAAAKLRGMLREVAPSVVLVEEAGEILEAQVLSTITDNTKQLILIGDHQQLRPKPECYSLRQESGNGFNLDVSLFERLVTHRGNGAAALPVVTLLVQHRMQPHVSHLVRQTMYPDLVDHPSTKCRPAVPGVLHSVLFINHKHTEAIDAESAALGGKSKVNVHEAEMVCRLARHLLHQPGCRPESITILTPYLGQLAEIRQRLVSLKVGSTVNDLDAGELFQLDEAAAAATSKGSGSFGPAVRAATVDNYQGEESDIILISLVRSNPQGDIGFLSSAQRVNVLLSRARNGMFIFGNMDCLTSCRSARGRELWLRLRGLLGAKSQLLDFLPLVCRRHRTVAKVREAADFDRLSPSGGCTLPCDSVLACGHPCPLACHQSGSSSGSSAAASHTGIRCTELLADVCSYGHPLQRECAGSARCSKHVSWKCAQGHTLSGICRNGRPVHCRICDSLEKQEARAAAKEQEYIRLLQDKEERLAGLKAELESLHQREAGQEEMEALQREEDLLQAELVRLQTNNSVKPPPPPLPRQRPSNMSPKSPPSSEQYEANSDKDSLAAFSSAGNPAPSEAEEHTMPPSEHQTQCPVRTNGEEGDLAAVLERYLQKGALQADNLLDTMLPSEPASQSQQHPKIAGLNAMRFILQRELDPLGRLRWEPPGSLKGHSTHTSIPLLQQALCHWASFLSYTTQYPMQAKEHAKQLCRIARFHGDLQLPAAWLEQANKAVSSPSGTASSADHVGSGSTNMMKQAAENASREKWKSVLAKDPSAPAVMTSVLAMVGLDSVKSELVSQYHRIKLGQQQGDGAMSSYNVRLDGNPGTGKTTVARHYATFLRQLGVLPEESRFLEASGAGLSNQGIPYLEKELEQMKEAGGGIVFVDEAYQLTADQMGRKVLDFILPLAEGLESKYGRLVWLFAGYSKDMEHLFEHNLGLPSRFPVRFKFDDYSDPELLHIFRGLMETKAPSPQKSENHSAGSSAGGQPAVTPMQRGARTAMPMGSTATDRFGNVWTWKGAAWNDQYGNVTGYGQDADLGTAANPVVSTSGQSWTYTGGKWTVAGTKPQVHYPGSPAPVAPTPAPAAAIPRDIPFTCASDKDLRIAIRGLGRGRGRPGFGNARAVRTLFEQVRSRQAKRLERCGTEGADLFRFTQEDLLGGAPTASRLRQTATYQKLRGLEGLQPVKDQVEQLITLVDKNWHRELREEPPLEVVLNRVFLGNPGTGKTTVAALYGKLLGEMGLLSKGDVVLKNPSDFVGDVLGSSEKATRAILKSAEGCVLVIDEAYSLYSGGSSGAGNNDPYKTAVVDTLVEQVQASAGDDRAVVLLGYEEEMRTMMKHVNPGLSRRFQLENAFVFPDFSDESLIRVLSSKVKAAGLQIDLLTAKLAVASLAKARTKPNFGNAGAVENLLSTAKLGMLSRLGSDGKTLTADDFSLGASASGPDRATLDTIFSDLVGCAGVKTKLEELRDTVLFMQGGGEAIGDAVSFGWVFTGAPGTGKTTVARRMGDMFAALGLLPDCTVNDVSASDLMTGYAGQTGIKTKEIMQQSRGGVLFIDEAYQLNPQRGGAYATEAVDELVKGMTSPEFKGKLLVILAGYKADMDAMMATNPGLQSRFAERLHFENLSVDATASALTSKMEALLPLASCARQAARGVAEALTKLPGFGNYRDVETLCQKTKQKVASRVKARSRGAAVTKADLQLALEDMQTTRAPLDWVDLGALPLVNPPPTQQQGRHAAPFAPAVSTRAEMHVQLEEADAILEEGQDEMADWVDVDGGDASGPLFSGVDPRVLRQLQTMLDSQGLQDEAAMRRMAALDRSDPELRRLQGVLTQELGLEPEEAMQQLLEWQRAHKDLQAELEKQREMEAAASATQEPIWRCAVCGRADQPWIACWVAPYIVYYRPISSSK